MLTMTNNDDYDDVLRLRDWTASGVDTNRQWYLVVLHTYYNLFIHGKLDFVSDDGAPEVAHRVRGGSCQADRNQVRHDKRWFYHDVLQGMLAV